MREWRKVEGGGLNCAYIPAMASSILRRAPNVDMPSSLRSWSERVRNVARSI